MSIIEINNTVKTILGVQHLSAKVLKITKTKRYYAIGIATEDHGISTTLSIGHVEGDIIIVDEIFNWMSHSGLEINYDSIAKLVLEFSKVNTVKTVVLDTFDSFRLEKIFANEQFVAKTVSLAETNNIQNHFDAMLSSRKLKVQKEDIESAKESISVLIFGCIELLPKRYNQVLV